MSQQGEGVLTIFQLVEELVRSQVVVSKDGYSCDGTDLFAFPESGDSTFALNDVINTEAATDVDISALEAKTFLINNDGTFTTPIQAPNNSQKPLTSFGFRFQEVGGFVYDAPIVLSTPYPEPARIVDRKFENTPTELEVTNFQERETIAEFDSLAVRDTTVKVQISPLPLSTSTFQFTTVSSGRPFAIGSDGSFYVFTDNSTVTKFDSSGVFDLDWTLNGTYTGSGGIAVDSSDNVYTLSSDSVGFDVVIEKHSSLGVFAIKWDVQNLGGPSIFARGLGINSLDEIYAIVDETSGADSTTLSRWDTSGASLGSNLTLVADNRAYSTTIAFDSNNDIYVLGISDDIVQVVSRTSFTIIRSWTSDGSFIAISGDIVYVSDSGGIFTVSDTSGNVIASSFTRNSGHLVIDVNGDFFIHDGTIIIKYALPSTILDVDVLTSTGDANFISQVSQTLTANIPSTVLTGSVNMKLVKVVLRALLDEEFTCILQIFDVSSATNPVVIFSDWSETSNMVDGDLSTANYLEVININPTLSTIVDFTEIENRDFSTNIQTDIISGTPTLTYLFEGTNDLITFTTIDSGSLTDGVLEKVVAASETFRHVRITQIPSDIINPYVAKQSIFEVWDGLVLNGLDFSTIKVGGSTTQDTTVNQTDALVFQISDAQTILHPPRYFDIEINKFYTVEVTVLRTGQTIRPDRAMTWQRNFTV